MVPKENIDFSVLSSLFKGMKPDPVLTVSEWSDRKRILSASSAEPGPFRTSRTPYNKEIMDRLSATDPAQFIIYKKSSQVGATELGNNWVGYTIDVDPSPMLYLMPTDALMKKTSKTRLQPMIDTTPDLKEKVKPSRSRDSGNTILEKSYPGGPLTMVGGNSPVGLSSVAVKKVYGDEIDRLPLDVGGEGSAVDLATTRTITFGSRKKILLTSTPTRKGQSIIDTEYEKTCQCEYHLPCPHCGAMQVLKFTQLRYDKKNYASTTYECEHCHKQIAERFKPQMLSSGVWIPKFSDRVDGITWGYFINALYSPLGWYSWAQMAKDYEDSEGDIPKRITFVNTKLGECYETEGDSPQWELLYAQRENYKTGTCKLQVAFITAGVDVQADRIEVEIVGWMKGKKSQSIDYRVITGDTSFDTTWDKLELLLSETFLRTDGMQMQINIMAVDTGYNTSHVYDFCNRSACAGRVVPVKGSDSISVLFRAPQPVQYSRQGKAVNSIKVFSVGVSLIKSELYGWLKQVKNDDGTYPNGYCHFPEYNSEYFKGITAEKLEMKTNAKNFNVFTWVKKYKRNEPLDCRVYARAAAAIYNMDLFNDEYWDKMQSLASSVQQKEEKKKEKQKSNFWKR